MKYSYFPGCTLKTKGKELDVWGRACAEALGFTLEEPANWQCCGAVYPMARDEIATRLSSVRVLLDAKDRGVDLVTMCSACHHVIKRVNCDMKNDAVMADRVARYMGLEEPYTGEVSVLHYLEVLRDRIGFDKLKEKVTNPLTGRKIGAYYGCLLLRPSKEMCFDDPENPTIMEDFIRAIGAEPVIYSRRNECCGGYCTMENRDYAKKQVDKIMENAKAQGAEMLITACPLCLYNLTQNAADGLSVKYFTQLLAEALGIKEDQA